MFGTDQNISAVKTSSKAQGSFAESCATSNYWKLVEEDERGVEMEELHCDHYSHPPLSLQCCTLLPALLLVSSGQLGKPWLLIGWEGNGGSWRTLPELLQCWGRWWNLALIVHNNALDCSAMQCKVGLHVYIDLRSLLLTLHLPSLLQVLTLQNGPQ